MWEIRPYRPDLKEEWNSFVTSSRNATFLFDRGYMDYHADRFEDRSLMAYRKGRLAAVLPADIDGTTLWSHRGLTYGGWALATAGLDTTDIFHLWRTWFLYCQEHGVERIVYKPLPYIYAEMPSQEDLYLLGLSGARLLQTDISTALDLTANPGFNKLQRRHLRQTEGTMYIEIHDASRRDDIKEFHTLLRQCLTERHATAPVHTLDELQLLMDRFKDNILIWSAYEDESDELLAAVCVYETGRCVHCQYIATSPRGRELNAMAFLVNEMVELYTQMAADDRTLRYLDFGISNEEGGRLLNAGLNRQKTSYGGSGVACQRYEINVSSALKSLPTSLWPAQ